VAKSKSSKRSTPARKKIVKSIKKSANPRKASKPVKPSKPKKTIAPKKSPPVIKAAPKLAKIVKAAPTKLAPAKISPAKIAPAKLAKFVKPVVKDHRSSLVPASLLGPVSMTSGKPKKNQAGLLSRDLEHFRSLLLAKRRELLGDMSSMEREALRSTTGSNLSNLPIHMADMGTDNYEQEFTLGLVEKDRVLLREINQALAKIHDGTYGVCEGTGKPISKARLEAQPWAKYSIEYARKLEMGMLRPII
jgi:DnaK suppressor protein